MIRKPLLFLLIAIFAVCCGSGDSDIASSSEGSVSGADAEGAQLSHADMVTPPEAAYDSMLDYYMERLLPLVASEETAVLYLDFDGATVIKGTSVGQSFIPCSSSIRIPASGYNISEQQAIAARVRSHYERADVDIAIVISRPLSGLYTTVIVGGLYSDLGCGSNNTILGIAPFDPGNVLKADITFVFSEASFSATATADAITHESAHSYGLEHIDNTSAVMNPFVTRSVTGFDEGPIVNPSGLNSQLRQDSSLVLQDTLGTISSGSTSGDAPNDSSLWQNETNNLDINDDGCISALDALVVINFLNRNGVIELSSDRTISDGFVDSNGDGYVSAIDALRVINELGVQGAYCSQ